MKTPTVRIIIFIIVILSIFGSSVDSYAQDAQKPEISFDHPLKLDMPTNLAMIQDHDGFLWISTQNGLVKYDGYTPVVYRTGPDSISNDNVVALVEDKTGAIWIGSQGGGLDRYDKETNQFTHYRHNPQNPDSLGSDTIAYGPQALFFDRVGALWIGTQGNGLDMMETKTGMFTHYQHDPNNPASLNNNSIWSIAEDPAGQLWVGTASGLERFDRQANTFTHYQYNPDNPDSIGKGWVYRILADKQTPAILWVGIVGGGLNRFDTSTGTFTHYCHDPKMAGNACNDQIAALHEDDLHRLWIGWYGVPVEGGLSIFDPKTGVFTDFHPDPNDPGSLSANVVRAILQDGSGLIWIATQSGGLDKYDPAGQKFRLYQHDPHNPDSLSDNGALSFYEDRAGVMWFGTLAGGLNRYNRETDTFTRYQSDPTDPGSIRNNFVTRIFEDSAGVFWVTTRGGALCVFDRAAGRCAKQYEHDPQNPGSIPKNDSIRYIVEDKDDSNILWLAGYLAGLFKFDKRAEEFTAYLPNPDDPNSLNNDSIMHLYQDIDGIIWLSTGGGGLNRFDKTTNTFTHYVNNPNDPASLGSNQVWEVQEYTPGFLWVATIGGGLEKFDKQKHTFQRYTKDNGFPANGILTIRRDNSGNLWMGTDEGLVRFNPNTEQTRLYKKSDGLQSDVFLDAAAWVTRNGQMWFGGVNGVNSFYPDQIKDNSYKPPVYFTALTQGGEPLKNLNTALERVKEIKLDWQSNFFEFEVAALNFTNPGKNQYQYMLKGFDKDWYNAGTKRTGRYSGLPDGTYTLHVRGSNNDGVWSDQETVLKVIVVGPFWRSTWFMLLVGLAAVGSVIGGMLGRIRAIEVRHNAAEERRRELERLVAERTAQLEAANQELEAFAYSVSHDLRAPLRHIDSFLELLQKRTTTALDEKSQHYMAAISDSAKRMGMLIDDLLSFSRMGRNEISKSQVDLGELVQDVIREFRPETEGRDIQWQISPLPLVTGDRAMLRIVLSNLISNALKFTRSRSQAEIEIGWIPGPETENIFFIHDNGVGFDLNYANKLFGVFQRLHRADEFEGTGIGLANVRRIINRHGGKTSAEGEVGQGATFYFSLPASKQE